MPCKRQQLLCDASFAGDDRRAEGCSAAGAAGCTWPATRPGVTLSEAGVGDGHAVHGAVESLVVTAAGFKSS